MSEHGLEPSVPGARRAQRSSRLPRRQRPSRPRGGARRTRRTRRRTKGLAGTLGMTTLGAFVPGSGYLYAGRRALGVLVLLVWLAAIGGLGWYFLRDEKFGHALDLAFDPTLLRVAALSVVLALVVWAFVVFTSYRLVRPRDRPRLHTVVGHLGVAVLVIVGAAPALRAVQYAMVTADTVDTVFKDDVTSATAPRNATAEDPWAGKDRVNVLLLGGDGGAGRTGVRTDSMILASMDTRSGDTVLFSLPRNMQNAQFPEDSPLHDIYPDGYQTGLGDVGFDLLNAVYKEVPELHPGILGASDNEGADAIKQAVSGTLGVPVDYYLLVNLAGFQQVVDAMGGITVNVNQRVAINGDQSAEIAPTGYIEPGPSQHLDGFHALWFARGRYGADDYQRMDRQRCAVDALVDAADPTTLLTRYVDLAKTGKKVLYTDIPRDLGKPFVQLLLDVKDAKTKSVVFRRSDKFEPSNPDFDYVHDVVSRAIDPVEKKPGTKRKKVREEEDPAAACAYNPTEPVDTAAE